MAKNPLLKYFNHIPDKCSVLRAAEAFGLEKEDIFNWAEEHAIKLYIDLQIPLAVIGDGTEIDDYIRGYQNLCDLNAQDIALIEEEQQTVKQSRSSIELSYTPDTYNNNYQIHGRWLLPPFYAHEFRNSDYIEVDELYTDFSMLCGVELAEPYLLSLQTLNIINFDLERIAEHLTYGHPLPSLHNGLLHESLTKMKKRKPREESGHFQLLKIVMGEVPYLKADMSANKTYDVLAQQLARKGKAIPICVRTFHSIMSKINNL